MPGKILDVRVAPGQAVSYGQVIMTMEAMKMETEESLLRQTALWHPFLLRTAIW